MEMNLYDLTPPDMEGASCSIKSPAMNQNQLPVNCMDETLLALAMAFVPYQMWENPYAYDVAFHRGTVFPSLDKPFIGEEAVSE